MKLDDLQQSLIIITYRSLAQITRVSAQSLSLVFATFD